MPRLFRLVESGGLSFRAFIEDDGRSVTFTIGSDPQSRRALHEFTSAAKDEEALRYFAEWLKTYGVSLPSESNVTSELERLAKLKNDGVLTDMEFEAAKKRLLGL